MTAAQLLWLIGHGTVSLLITRAHFPWSDRKELLARLERLVMGGLVR